MNEIVVIGSINADLVFVSKKRPKAGETLIGEEFLTNPGGKGANQAIAASKLGSKVSMIGCVGNDIYGKKMIDNFEEFGVDASMVKSGSLSTGVAGIMIDKYDNSIVVIPGANNEVDIELIDKYRDIILNTKLVVLQLEIPLETVEYIINLCSENNIKTILNPAPARKLSEKLIENVTFITPNEHEVYEMFGNQNLENLLRKYPNKLIVTQGAEGVVFHDGQSVRRVSGMVVDVVDTTGAGDTFNGALATCIVKNKSILDSIVYANKVAAISITKYGAQGGMPTTKEVGRWK